MYSQRISTVFVIGKKICILPIIGKLNAIETIISKLSSELLKIENLFLPRIQLSVFDFSKSHV